MHVKIAMQIDEHKKQLAKQAQLAQVDIQNIWQNENAYILYLL